MTSESARGWRPITAPGAPDPRGGAYSVAAVAGDLVFTAGLGPVDPATGTIVGTEVGEQTRQVLRNLTAVLGGAGCTLDDVVKVTVHLANGDADWPAYNAAYLEFFRPPYPARTTAGSQLGSILVEIDVVAVRPPQR
ncbi:RidA family protein [Pseudonocardia sp. GCM10023141]|uniref:RidA family protein n=1 Tax=Pseudonocardia sp. GCM10023141 TaxID=3252653 RepID=UPI0036142D40